MPGCGSKPEAPNKRDLTLRLCMLRSACPRQATQNDDRCGAAWQGLLVNAVAVFTGLALKLARRHTVIAGLDGPKLERAPAAEAPSCS